jgi:hypothetical protein
MRNPSDYAAGLTASLLDARTGKLLSGGAARNRRIAEAGGLAEIQNRAIAAGIVLGVQQVQPLLHHYMAALQNQTDRLELLVKTFAHLSDAPSSQNPG